MARAPFQVLALPWRRTGPGVFAFAMFQRSDSACWQGIAGGGEGDETPLDAARREAYEEAGIRPDSSFLPLQTITSIRVSEFASTHHWGSDRYVVPEHAFGVDANGQSITLSREHTTYRWLPYEEAHLLLTWDGNRTALWELHRRLLGRGPRD